MGKTGWSATIIFFALGTILGTYEVQGVKMPTPLFLAIIIAMLLIVIIAFPVLVCGLLKAIRNTEWWNKHIYQISGVPKTLSLGEHKIPIVLQLGATRYIGRSYVYLAKEKGPGSEVRPSIASVSFDTEKANYDAGFRSKGEKISLILTINSKAQWKGWLRIGFATEIDVMKYVGFPITFQ